MSLVVEQLRVGNYIDYMGETVPVYHIDKRGKNKSAINDIVFDNRCIEDFYNPIPLSEQLLVVINAKATELPNCYLLGRYELQYNTIWKFCSVHLRDTDAYLTKVSFLHELQNFIYAMDGVEITIKHQSKPT